MKQEYYTPEEIAKFREQIKRANADAKAELEKRGRIGPHPRIVAWKAAQSKEQ